MGSFSCFDDFEHDILGDLLLAAIRLLEDLVLVIADGRLAAKVAYNVQMPFGDIYVSTSRQLFVHNSRNQTPGL